MVRCSPFFLSKLMDDPIQEGVHEAEANGYVMFDAEEGDAAGIFVGEGAGAIEDEEDDDDHEDHEESEDDEEEEDDDFEDASALNQKSFEERKNIYQGKQIQDRKARKKKGDKAAAGRPKTHEAKYEGNAPRRLADLLAVEAILSKGDEAQHRDEAELLTCEFFEIDGKLTTIKKVEGMTAAGLCKTNDRLVIGCACPDVGCKGRVAWNKGKGVGAVWRCTSVTKSSCLGITEASQKNGTTAYSVGMLKPTIIPLLHADRGTKGKVLAIRLQEFTKRAMMSDKGLPIPLVYKMKSEALKDIDGDPDKATHELPALIASYNDLGWQLNMEKKDSVQMAKLLGDSAKDKHRRMQSALPVAARQTYEDSELAGQVEGAVALLDANRSYVSSVSIVPPNAAHMYDHSHHVTSSDFTHLKGSSNTVGGIIGSRYGTGSNRELLDLAHTVWWGNESEEAWSKLNRATIAAIPAYNSPTTVDCTDGDKGARAAHDVTFPQAVHFFDFKHRKEAIAKIPAARGRGAAGAQAYDDTFNCSSADKIAAAKEGMADATRALLAKVPDNEQYPAARGLLRGRKGSSPGESGNHAMVPQRKAPPHVLVLQKQMHHHHPGPARWAGQRWAVQQPQRRRRWRRWRQKWWRLWRWRRRRRQ